MGDEGGARGGGKFPLGKPLFFIVMSQFFERLCNYAIRIITVLYMSQTLEFPDTKVAMHSRVFMIVQSSSSIFGGVLADSWLGKYKAIVFFSIPYVIGCLALTGASVAKMDKPILLYFGMALVAISAGLISPSRAAIGGDQYKLPDQRNRFYWFFPIYVFFIKLASVISKIASPKMSETMSCMGMDTCFPLGFGIPTLLIIISLLLFAIGYSFYKITPPQTNIFLGIFGCQLRALKNMVQDESQLKEHWLDYANDSYDQSFLNDMKIILKLLFVLLPATVFWALHEQQFYGWYYQGRLMNGKLGDYTILPRSMQIANPFFIVVNIVFLEVMIYPCLEKFHIRRPLQRMCCGGFLAAMAFFMSGYLAKVLDRGTVPLPQIGIANVRIYNTALCEVNVTCKLLNGGKSFMVDRLGIWAQANVTLCGKEEVELTIIGDCFEKIVRIVTIEENKTIGIHYFSHLSDGRERHFRMFYDDVQRHPQGKPKFRIIADRGEDHKYSYIMLTGKFHNTLIKINPRDWWNVNTLYEIRPDTYILSTGWWEKWWIVFWKWKTFKDSEHQILGGSVTTLLVGKGQQDAFVYSMHRIIQPSNMSILWQLPQYYVFAAGEVMMYVTGMEFVYSESPMAMKAMGQSIFMATYALGHYLGAIVAAVQLYDDMSSNFNFYGGLMLIDTLVFAIFAMFYKYETYGTD